MGRRADGVGFVVVTVLLGFECLLPGLWGRNRIGRVSLARIANAPTDEWGARGWETYAEVVDDARHEGPDRRARGSGGGRVVETGLDKLQDVLESFSLPCEVRCKGSVSSHESSSRLPRLQTERARAASGEWGRSGVERLPTFLGRLLACFEEGGEGKGRGAESVGELGFRHLGWER